MSVEGFTAADYRAKYQLNSVAAARERIRKLVQAGKLRLVGYRGGIDSRGRVNPKAIAVYDFAKRLP